MFTERKIEKFQQTVSALPDTPNLSAAELKRRFDACPEELRAALNGVCDDGAALKNAWTPIARKLSRAKSRAICSPAVRGEISGKADAGTNDAAHEVFSAQIAKKCEVYFGTYTGDGKATQFRQPRFYAKAVLCLLSGSRWVSGNYVNGGIALQNAPAGGTSGYITIVENGFEVTYKRM